MKISNALLSVLLLLFFQSRVTAQDYSKFKPIAVNGYYFKNIVPFSEPSQAGFGVVIPAYINKDSLIDFYSTKTKFPQSGNSGYEVSTFEVFINQGDFLFKKDTRQYVKDSIFIIRDDGINAISDLNGDGIDDLVFAGEPFHYNPQSAYFNIGMRNKIDIDSSKYYARRPNVLISSNGKLVDSLGYLDTLLLKSYFGALVFDWNNDGKNDLVLSERGDGKTFQFWENKINKMSVSYPILERDTLQVTEGPYNLAAYDFNKDGFKDFVFSSQVEGYISQNGNLFVCFNENGQFNNSSVVNVINHREFPVQKNGLRASNVQINDLDNDGNPEIISLFSNGSGDHSAIDNNKIKSIFKITTYKDGKFTDVTKKYFPTKLNENLFYSNRLFKLIDLDNDGLIDIYPITGDNGCTSNAPRGCGYFGFQGIDSTVYFKNIKGSFELKSLGLFFSDTASQNIYFEFKKRNINIGGYNLALGNQMVPYFIKGITKPVFITGTQKQSVEMYEGEIYSDSLRNIGNRLNQNSFLNYNFRHGFLMVPCESVKPTFSLSNLTFCPGDSLKLSITNVNKSDSIKWYFGSNTDLTNVVSKTFTDSVKLFVIRTDSIGCSTSSDTIQLILNSRPVKPNTVASSVCIGGSVSALNATASTGNSLRWYGTSATGGTASTSAPTASSSTAGVTNYYVSQVSTQGCESERGLLKHTVNPLPAKPVISWSGVQFSTTATGVNYQWLLNGTSISGATASTHKPLNTGDYKLRVTDPNGCINISDSFKLVVTAIANLVTTPASNIAMVYPNPASDKVVLEFATLPTINLNFQLVTPSGKVLSSTTGRNKVNIVDVSKVKSGNYFIRVIGKKYDQVKKVLIQK